MAFRIKRSVALKVCSDQVEVIITRPRFRDKEWTDVTLREYLVKDLGLDYTLEEIQHINDELHDRGIIEDI